MPQEFTLLYFRFNCFLNWLINFSWRLITLQYCGGFCHTLTWVSYGCTCVPTSQTTSHHLPHPSGLSQHAGFECPISCIKLGPVICFTYGNIHVSILFSQITPPSSSPPESKSLFCTSISLAILHIELFTIFLNSISIVNILYWCFSLWLTSFCVIGSSFIHLIRNDSNAFFLIAE